MVTSNENLSVVFQGEDDMGTCSYETGARSGSKFNATERYKGNLAEIDGYISL